MSKLTRPLRFSKFKNFAFLPFPHETNILKLLVHLLFVLDIEVSETVKTIGERTYRFLRKYS